MIQIPNGATISLFQSSMPLTESGAKRIGPSTASRPTHIPGVMERLDLIRTLKLQPDDPHLMMVMPKHRLFNFTQETGIGLNLAVPIFQGKVSYEKAVENGILDKIRNMLKGSIVINEFEKVDYVPIAEVHCPHVSGCKATYIHETKGKHDHFLDIKVLSLGGGSGVSKSVGIGYEIPAQEDCRQILIPVKIRARQIKPFRGNPFISADIVEILTGYKVSIIRERHFCKIDYEYINKKSNILLEPYNLGGVHGPHKITKSIDIGKKNDFEFGINFQEIGTEIKLIISVEVIRQVKFEYQLAGGHNYIGYFPMPNSSIFCWTWKNGKRKTHRSSNKL